MARLYDEIVKRNAVETEGQIHDLNVFFSRLLFCFFAEDTGVFEKGSFTNAIGSLSLKGGEDVHELPRPDLRRSQYEAGRTDRFPVPPPVVRLRQRQALRATFKRPNLLCEGSVDCPRVRDLWTGPRSTPTSSDR